MKKKTAFYRVCIVLHTLILISIFTDNHIGFSHSSFLFTVRNFLEFLTIHQNKTAQSTLFRENKKNNSSIESDNIIS